jgi:hypothetical protein
VTDDKKAAVDAEVTDMVPAKRPSALVRLKNYIQNVWEATEEEKANVVKDIEDAVTPPPKHTEQDKRLVTDMMDAMERSAYRRGLTTAADVIEKLQAECDRAVFTPEHNTLVKAHVSIALGQAATAIRKVRDD